MTQGDTIAFCPKCEGKYPPTHQNCPEDGTDLLSYQMVEEEGRDRLVGEVLEDRFRIEEPLSKGGMGTVYRGSQIGFERDVAIKVLAEDASSDERQVQRFLREARTLSKLSHPNIVNFVDFGQDPNHQVLYLVMELIEGCELASVLEGSRLAPEFAVEVVTQMCSALAEPHHHGVVHRDLKPANVMLQSRLDGSIQVKLVDFGIANAMHTQTRLTQTGVACGTPHYMAPEQVEGERESPAIDIYGLGSVMYRMITGDYVFDATTDVQILMKHLEETPPSLEQVSRSDDIPPALVELIDDMLAKIPDERPESVLEVRDRLRKIRRRQPGWLELDVDPELPVERAFDPWILPRNSGSPPARVPDTDERPERRATGRAEPETSETTVPSPPDAGMHEVADRSTEPASPSEEMRSAAPTGPESDEGAGLFDTIRERPDTTMPTDPVDPEGTADASPESGVSSTASDDEPGGTFATTQKTAGPSEEKEEGLPRLPLAVILGSLFLVAFGLSALYFLSLRSESKSAAAAAEREDPSQSAAAAGSSSGMAAAGTSADAGENASDDAGGDVDDESADASGSPPAESTAETPREASDENTEDDSAPGGGRAGAAGTDPAAGRGSEPPSGRAPESDRAEESDEGGGAAAGADESETDEVEFEPVPETEPEGASENAEEEGDSDSFDFEPVPGDK